VNGRRTATFNLLPGWEVGTRFRSRWAPSRWPRRSWSRGRWRRTSPPTLRSTPATRGVGTCFGYTCLGAGGGCTLPLTRSACGEWLRLTRRGTQGRTEVHPAGCNRPRRAHRRGRSHGLARPEGRACRVWPARLACVPSPP